MNNRPQSLNVLTPVLTAITLVAFGALMAILLGRAANQFLPELNDPPVLPHNCHPGITNRPEKKTNSVTVLVIDGLRIKESYYLAFLNYVRTFGIDSQARSHYPSYSIPNYISILSGVPPQQSGVRNNQFRRPLGLGSIMDSARKSGLFSAYVSNSSSKVATIYSHPRYKHDDDYQGDFDVMKVATWPGGVAHAGKKILRRNYVFNFVLVGNVDHSGHLSGG